MGKEQGPVQSVGRTEVAKLQYPLMLSVKDPVGAEIWPSLFGSVLS